MDTIEIPKLEPKMKAVLVKNRLLREPMVNDVVTIISRPTYSAHDKVWYVWIEDDQGRSYNVATWQISAD